MVKIPVIGLHYWLPKAHVEASTRGSIILAGLLLKLGCYGIYRYVRILLKIPTLLTWLWLVLTILAGLVTLIQSDVKKLIAYSRVVHITLLMIAVYTDINILRILLLVSLAHGGASILLFFPDGFKEEIYSLPNYNFNGPGRVYFLNCVHSRESLINKHLNTPCYVLFSRAYNSVLCCKGESCKVWVICYNKHNRLLL